MIFCVHPNVRGAGTARKLLRLFEEYVMNHGLLKALPPSRVTAHIAVPRFCMACTTSSTLVQGHGWRGK